MAPGNLVLQSSVADLGIETRVVLTKNFKALNLKDHHTLMEFGLNMYHGQSRMPPSSGHMMDSRPGFVPRHPFRPNQAAASLVVYEPSSAPGETMNQVHIN